MGTLKLIFWSLFGPFLIWLILAGQIVYQVRNPLLKATQVPDCSCRQVKSPNEESPNKKSCKSPKLKKYGLEWP